METRFKKSLTQVLIDKRNPPEKGRDTIADVRFPGFEYRISAPRSRGKEPHRAWRLLVRINGRQVALPIDYRAYPRLKEAHERAREFLRLVAEGIDPREEEKRQQQEVEERAHNTLAAAIDRYLDKYAKHRMRPGYFKETKRALKVDVAAVLGSRPICEVTRREIRDLLDAIVHRGRAPHASHVLAYLRAMLNWAVANDLIETNPAAGIPDPDPRKRQDRERDRYLTDTEIRAFWRACDRVGWPFGPFFKLLLLLGARREELARAAWGEFDLERQIWVLPRRRSKNDKEHITHLAQPAIEILTALPRTGENGFLFTTTGCSPISGFGRGRERLAAAMPGVEPFTLHDLRRTFATGMASLGVGEHIVDRVLNHTGRKVSGTARIYNRHEYLKERQVALESWAAHVQRLVDPSDGANVILLVRNATR